MNFFVQARLGSTRLPRKVLRKFSNGQTLLELVTDAVLNCRYADRHNVVLLTTTNPADDELVDFASRIGIGIFRGSEDNVLERFHAASVRFPSKYYVRVCADNPFLQVPFMNELIQSVSGNGAPDYVTYRTWSGKPVIQTSLGLFVELFSGEALRKASAAASDRLDLEHVTRFFYTNPDKFVLRFLSAPNELDEMNLRFTVDNADDLANADAILRILAARRLEPNYENILLVAAGSPDILQRMHSNIEADNKI